MTITPISSSPADASPTAANPPRPTTGFEALFWNPDIVPAAQVSVDSQPTGFEALFGNSTYDPNAIATSSGPTGFEALFGNTNYDPNAAGGASGPTGFEALFGNSADLSAGSVSGLQQDPISVIDPNSGDKAAL